MSTGGEARNEVGEKLARLKGAVRDVPDFPKKGIVFRDITPILADPGLLEDAVDLLVEPYAGAGVHQVVGIESRGFIFGPPVAMRLGAGFVPVRKRGKLPADTISSRYELEYGTAEIEIHRDAIAPGERVIIVDDLIATGGTAAATVALVRRLGGEIVGASFLIELSLLKGRDKIPGVPVYTHIVY